MADMNVLFMGSPIFCTKFLREISTKHDIVGIVTKPDYSRKKRRSGRENNSEWFALTNNIILLQPDELNERLISRVRHLKPDIILVVAYGKKLPVKLLRIPVKGCVNIHFSLLPEYRGPAPVRWALLNGETETGVTSIFMDEDIDTGKIILQKKVPVNLDDNYESLLSKLVDEGCDLMKKTLSLVKSGKARPVQQNLSGKYRCAPLIKKRDSKINWNNPAVEVYNKIRAFYPDGAWTEVRTGDGTRKVLKILAAAEPPLQDSLLEGNCEPGRILEMEKNSWVVVKCGKGCLRVLTVRAESKSRCCAYDYLLGARLRQGDNIIYVE